MRFSAALPFLFVAIMQFVTDPAINACKRNDSHIEDCFCSNLRIMIGVMKDGVPEMNIPSINPFAVDKVFVDLSELQTIQLIGTLNNVSIAGFANATVPSCKFKLVDTGVEAQIDFHIPDISLNSLYQISGTFTVLKMNATGDFNAEFKEAYAKTSWSSSKFIKNRETYLKINADFSDFAAKTLNLHFNKLFGDNAELNERVNDAIAENIDFVFYETTPIALQILKEVVLEMINYTFEAFPFDKLFPLA